MKKILKSIRDFRQKRLFLFPREAQCVVVVAQQLAREELEAVREEYHRLCASFMKTKTHFRASKNCYEISFSVDAVALVDNVDLGCEAAAREIARQIRHRHLTACGKKN